MDRVTPLESILQASRITNHPNSCWEHGYPLSEAFLTTDQKDRPSFYLRYRDREAGLGGVHVHCGKWGLCSSFRFLTLQLK